MATEVIKTIKTSSGDYTSLSGWEAGQQADITLATGNDTIQIAECYSMSDTTKVVFAGWTTAAGNYIKIYAPASERHDGKWNSSKYRLEVTAGANDDAGIKTGDYHIRIENIQISMDESTYSDSACVRIQTYSGSGEVRISQDIIKNVGSSSNVTHGIFQDFDGTSYIWNNAFYDFNASVWSRAINEDGGGASVLYVYSNTIHNCARGILANDSNTITAKNNIIQSTTDPFYGTMNSASTHNIIESAASEGAFGATWSTGTTTSATANKLVDSGATFSTDGVQVGSIIKNTTDTTYSYVTAVDSETQLSITDDIMANSEGYEVYANMYGAVTFEDEANDDFHLGSTDTVAIDKGKDTSGESAPLDFSVDVDGDARGATWDVGMDEYIAAGGFNIGDLHRNQFRHALTR